MSAHTHPDPDKLTAQCPACIEQAAELRAAAIDKQPWNFSPADREWRARQLRDEALEHRDTAYRMKCDPDLDDETREDLVDEEYDEAYWCETEADRILLGKPSTRWATA